MWVYFEGVGQSSSLLDISYGGFAIKPSESAAFVMHERYQGQLVFFDEALSIVCSPAYLSADKIGFQLIHEDVSGLIKLQPLLELLRQGHSLYALDRSLLKEKFQNPSYHVFRGDGPVDLVLETQASDSEKLQSALLTYPSGERYLDVRYLNGAVTTGAALVQQGSSQQVIPDPTPHPLTLSQGLILLTGARLECAKELRPALDELLAACSDTYTNGKS